MTQFEMTAEMTDAWIMIVIVMAALFLAGGIWSFVKALIIRRERREIEEWLDARNEER